MENYKVLISKYNSQSITVKEQEELEKLIEQGLVQLSELEDVDKLLHMIPQTNMEIQSESMDLNFYSMLADKKQNVKGKINTLGLISWWKTIWQYNYQWGYSATLVIIGLGLGYWWNSVTNTSSEVQQLTSEVQQMKELVMLSMLDKNSTTERLKAVSLTSEIDVMSPDMSSALISVLRNDENTNVRLAAVNALAQFTNDPKVRGELINSIKYQDSPLVQLALAELMVIMKEKKALKEFNEIIEDQNTPIEVKNELKNTIETLI